MRSSEYWAKRAAEREQHWHDKSKATIEKELAELYRRALQNIWHDIEALYGRFAVDNKLPPDKARELIRGNEYRYWRMDIESYLKKIKAGKDSGKLLLELNTLSMRSRITRLQQLYSKTLREIISLAIAKDKKITGFLGGAYKGCYKECANDFKQAGLKGSWAEVDSGQIENILRTPWSGKNYSQRIWKDAEKLSHTIRDEIANSVHRGLSVNKTSMLVKNRMNVSMSNARRLVRTELNYVNNQAALDGIKDAGIEYYEFIATIDRRTSKICREHNGKIFPVKEAQVGTNVPPLHPNCRSTIAATFDKSPEERFEKMRKNLEPPTDEYIKTIADKYKLPYTIGKKGNERFYTDNGHPIYPENDGAIGEEKEVILPVGYVMDRYGDTRGSYTSPINTPWTNRALPKESKDKPYHAYRVLKPIKCNRSKVAPWFGEKGQGIQYRFERAIEELINLGFIKGAVKNDD